MGCIGNGCRFACGHGKWLGWLEKNVRFSQQQASRYMRLAKLPVTGSLRDEWKVLSDNADDDEAHNHRAQGTA